jgi:hypoxanthine phosphoribosyltransferase
MQARIQGRAVVASITKLYDEDEIARRVEELAGEVRLIGAVPEEVAGRAVLVVDDIVDTGRSLAYARDRLLEAGASKVWTCTLLDKPSRREVEFTADFVGFLIEDVFVVGYGIDFAERYRHLPYIGVVE